MESKMFCYQCEQTAGGKGCTVTGVCGKDPQVAALQDLLLYNLQGIAFYGQKILEQSQELEQNTHQFMIDALFATLTNVNFDQERFISFLRQAQIVKEQLKQQAGKVNGVIPPEALYEVPEKKDQILADAQKTAIFTADNVSEDIRSLRSLLIFGAKGMAAYAHHAYVLGKSDKLVNNFLYKALAATLDDNLSIDDLVKLNMMLGKVNFRCMELLDEANISSFGSPTPTEVLITKKKGPFIIVSGHDLKDLKELLEQTKGKGINIYTHGEMLPAHSYPELKKYSHLVGNYGGAWQNQQKEFDGIPGCILMTTNCIQKPKESYQDRIFTTSIVGWPNTSHIQEVNGQKDFTPIITKALELVGWTEDEAEKKILVGFGHDATLSHAGEIIQAVKEGAIKHFFLIGGCDGVRAGRNYYTELAEKVPQDAVILTLACGKYRFNRKDFGTVAGLPRLLDVGQCNDAYSAVKIALALADAFDCGVNDLPLSLILSWYEQKAVCILLTLLSLGIKDIRLGPTLPAFVSSNVLQVLVDNFDIKPISTPDEDLQAILGK
ncbi:hydroxylamine reductase [Bacillota bacterium LX-D]|nr:hydroxylamine reductase [Bacillota bacterium LX-D]